MSTLLLSKLQAEKILRFWSYVNGSNKRELVTDCQSRLTRVKVSSVYEQSRLNHLPKGRFGSGSPVSLSAGTSSSFSCYTRIQSIFIVQNSFRSKQLLLPPLNDVANQYSLHGEKLRVVETRNVVLPTLFNVVNNVVQHCYTRLQARFRLNNFLSIVDNIEQCGQHNIVQSCFQQPSTTRNFYACSRVNTLGARLYPYTGCMEKGNRTLEYSNAFINQSTEIILAHSKRPGATCSKVG